MQGTKELKGSGATQSSVRKFFSKKTEHTPAPAKKEKKVIKKDKSASTSKNNVVKSTVEVDKTEPKKSASASTSASKQNVVKSTDEVDTKEPKKSASTSTSASKQNVVKSTDEVATKTKAELLFDVTDIMVNRAAIREKIPKEQKIAASKLAYLTENAREYIGKKLSTYDKLNIKGRVMWKDLQSFKIYPMKLYWTSDGSQILLAAHTYTSNPNLSSHCLYAFEYPSGRIVQNFQINRLFANSHCIFNKDGTSLIISRVEDIDNERSAILEVFDIKKESLVDTFRYSGGSFAWSPDGLKIAYNKNEQSICYYDIKTRRIVDVYNHRESVWSIKRLSWSPNSQFLAISINDKTKGSLYICEFGTRDKPSVTKVYDFHHNMDDKYFQYHVALEWSPNSAMIALMFNSGSIVVFDVHSRVVKSQIHSQHLINRYYINDLKWSPDGSKIATATNAHVDQRILIFHVEETLHLWKELHLKYGKIVDFAWKPDGKYIVYANQQNYTFIHQKRNSTLDRSIWIWDVEHGDHIQGGRNKKEKTLQLKPKLRIKT
jgi:WD40 repeat protein